MAEAEINLAYEAYKHVPPDRFIYGDFAINVLKVGESVMMGEFEYRKENYDVAFNHLR